MEELKVGDEIYSKHYSKLSFVGKVERVTKTMAFTKNDKFKREIRNGKHVNIIGRDTWSSASYFLPSESDKVELKYQIKQSYVANFKYSELNPEKIERIFEIIRPK